MDAPVNPSTKVGPPSGSGSADTRHLRAISPLHSLIKSKTSHDDRVPEVLAGTLLRLIHLKIA